MTLQHPISALWRQTRAPPPTHDKFPSNAHISLALFFITILISASKGIQGLLKLKALAQSTCLHSLWQVILWCFAPLGVVRVV